jgi:hypothetical protein
MFDVSMMLSWMHKYASFAVENENYGVCVIDRAFFERTGVGASGGKLK